MSQEHEHAKVRHLIALSPRGAWVRKWLLVNTSALDYIGVVRNALRLQYMLLKMDERRLILYSKQTGDHPLFPLDLLTPATWVELPPEADKSVRETFAMFMDFVSQHAFNDLRRLSGVSDSSQAVEHALCLHYDLDLRNRKGTAFYYREKGVAKFKELDLFASEA